MTRERPQAQPAATSRTTALEPRSLKRRAPRAVPREKKAMETSPETRPLLDGDTESDAEMAPEAWSRRNRWIVFAMASGACAAFNGVFAKL